MNENEVKAMEQSNLTSPIEIKHALERVRGYGAISRLAEEHHVSRSAMTNAVAGRRPGSHLLQIIAAEIGQPVHGVLPNGQSLDS